MNGAPLFGDELAEIEEAAVAALGRSGASDVLSIAEVSALRAAVAAGRVVEGGAQCVVAPTVEDALYAAFPGASAASLELSCVGSTCKPTLSIARARAEAEIAKRLVGAVVNAIDPASWRQSIEAGTWADPSKDAVPNGTPDTGQFGPLTVQSLTCFGDCAKPPTRATFPNKLFAACTNDDVRVLAAFDAAGAPGRCETDACACAGVAKAKLAKSEAARRLFVDLGAGPGGKRPAGGGRFGGGLVKPFKVLRGVVSFAPPAFPRFEQSPDVRKDLSGCLQSTRTEDSKVAITLTLSPSGLIEKLELAEGHGFSEREESCLAERLPKLVTFTCPGTNTSVAASLEIRAKRAPSKAEPSPRPTKP